MLKRFIKYVSQNMLGMLGMSFYILADTFFISKAVGADGITALNLVLPLYNLIFAIGAMIGVGSAIRYVVERGRNEKAVIAMRDMESLKGSKNQSEDIKKALEDVKKSDGYLFGANEPINNQVGSLGGGSGTDADSMVSLRAAMGLPEKN